MNAISDRVRFERYRLMLISAWPESDAKRAALASAQAVLERELAPVQFRPGEAPVVVRGVAA